MGKLLLIPIGVMVATYAAFGGDCRRGRPVRKFCHLPCYDYRAKSPGNPAQQTTTAAIELTLDEKVVEEGEAGLPRTTQKAVKVFQLATSEIRVQHCRLSQFTMTVVEDGTWTVNCIAEQNPNLVASAERPPLFNFKRNKFFVDVRGVNMSQLSEPPAERVVGQPQLFKISPNAFWLGAGEKKVMRWTGDSSEAGRFFELVNRVDVDLRYE